jgi:hypothetical protein
MHRWYILKVLHVSLESNIPSGSHVVCFVESNGELLKQLVSAEYHAKSVYLTHLGIGAQNINHLLEQINESMVWRLHFHLISSEQKHILHCDICSMKYRDVS